MPCFFTPHLKSNEKKITISGEEFHHITHVFRRKPGDEILLTNGAGLLATSRISAIEKKTLEVDILETIPQQKSHPGVAVAFPLLKNKHDLLIVEKLTELGVKEFFPLITARTVRQPSSNTIDKFKKTAISAIKQCDNAFLPEINQCSELKEIVMLLKQKNYTAAVALEFGEHKPLSKILDAKHDPLCLIIGPEGGFTKEETEFMQQNDVISFTLGNHVLRAETAAISAASQVLGIYLAENPHYY